MYYIIPFTIWPLVYLFSTKYLFNTYPIKLTRNLIGFIDAAICCTGALGYYVYGNRYAYEYSLLFPISYYIWDSYLITIKELNKEIMFVYHHIIALFLLNELFFAEPEFINKVYPILVSAELCNIPLYISYYIIKTNPVIGDNENKLNNMTKIIYSKGIQLMLFIIIRVIYYSYFFYYELGYINRNNYFKGAISTVYIMGIFWLVNQLKGFWNDITLYKQLKYDIDLAKND